MTSQQDYSILNLDLSSTTDKIISDICDEIGVNYVHTTDKMQTLEILMDVQVNAVVLHTNVTQPEIIDFLNILNQDIENKNTPIVIISDLENSEDLISSVEAFNVISVIAYGEWKPQLRNLISFLQSQSVSAKMLKRELIQSENRNVIDSLTGAFNRYGAQDKFHHLTSRFKAYDEHFSMIMLDIDHFKQVNDVYGHDVGDEVLISISSLIQNSIRGDDSFIRFGGEEFFIFTANTNLENCVKIAEKFRLLLEEKIHSSKNLKISSSFGVVEYVENEDLDSIIKRVDTLLYKAKADGRNRVVSAL